MVVTDSHELESFTVDWMKKWRSAEPSLALCPRDTKTVSAILKVVTFVLPRGAPC
jgi:FAD/FMN-containing dehydrogenase